MNKLFVLMSSVMVVLFSSMAFAAEAATAVAADTESGIAALIAKVGVIAIDLLGPTILVLGSWLAYKVAKRFGIEMSVSEVNLVDGYIGKAIAATEKWAANKVKSGGGKPTSSDKLIKAVDHANTFITASGLKKKGSDYLAALVEARLQDNESVA